MPALTAVMCQAPDASATASVSSPSPPAMTSCPANDPSEAISRRSSPAPRLIVSDVVGVVNVVSSKVGTALVERSRRLPAPASSSTAVSAPAVRVNCGSCRRGARVDENGLETCVADRGPVDRDGAGVRVDRGRLDRGGRARSDDERVEPARAAVDARDRAGSRDDEGVLVARGADELLDVGERDARDGAGVWRGDGPRGVARWAADRVDPSRPSKTIETPVGTSEEESWRTSLRLPPAMVSFSPPEASWVVVTPSSVTERLPSANPTAM